MGKKTEENGYMKQAQIDEADDTLQCPARGMKWVAAEDCRKKCRFYYGRGEIRFVEDPKTRETDEEGAPKEFTKLRWHLCNHGGEVVDL